MTTDAASVENRIDRRLADAAGRGALLPFVTAGYPDLEATAEWVRRFDALSITALEIGFPYSDSIADGPVIQESFHRALSRGLRIGQIFECVAAVRPAVNIALLAMVSFSIVRRIGTEAFVADAASSGFDGLIVPDVPFEESGEVTGAVTGQGMRHAMLVAPTTPTARATEIARRSTGFVYLVAARGITGERTALPPNVRDRVAGLRRAARTPVCVGFGISTAAHVRQVCRMADGAIVGTAVVRRVTEALDAGEGRERIVSGVSAFVEQLAEGIR
jgi:tryptophan synthase alpha chain